MWSLLFYRFGTLFLPVLSFLHFVPGGLAFSQDSRCFFPSSFDFPLQAAFSCSALSPSGEFIFPSFFGLFEDPPLSFPSLLVPVRCCQLPHGCTYLKAQLLTFCKTQLHVASISRGQDFSHTGPSLCFSTFLRHFRRPPPLLSRCFCWDCGARRAFRTGEFSQYPLLSLDGEYTLSLPPSFFSPTS